MAPSWLDFAWSALRGGLPWTLARDAADLAARHTAIPALVVAAAVLVVAYRVLKRVSRFLLEVALVAALLAAATHAGWLVW